jgi:hypothetical protein
MKDLKRSEESLQAEDREMLLNIHLNFERGPGKPRTWEGLSERDKETIRDLYRKWAQGSTGGR